MVWFLDFLRLRSSLTSNWCLSFGRCCIGSSIWIKLMSLTWVWMNFTMYMIFRLSIILVSYSKSKTSLLFCWKQNTMMGLGKRDTSLSGVTPFPTGIFCPKNGLRRIGFQDYLKRSWNLFSYFLFLLHVSCLEKLYLLPRIHRRRSLTFLLSLWRIDPLRLTNPISKRVPSTLFPCLQV